MEFDKRSGIQNIIDCTGSKVNGKNVHGILEELRKIATNEGFGGKDLDVLCDFLVRTKLTSQTRIILLGCLIPETKISKENIKKVILWFLTERNTLSSFLQKQFLLWLTGIAFYELTERSVIDSFYYSWLFLLEIPHLIGPVCKLLCVISRPECAKRWVVQRILEAHISSGSKSHTSSILNLFKSYRPEVVPERIPVTSFSLQSFGSFDDGLKSSHSRSLVVMEENAKVEDLKWNSWQLFASKKTLQRLIPPPENLNLDSAHLYKNENTLSVVDTKTMSSLGINMLKIKYPAQVLSLLANKAGFHLLTFGDDTVKSRFSHTLYHSLCKVFLLEMYPYLEKEKLHFLRAIKHLQEYSHQSIPVVSTFLLNYLLVWDGASYVDEIFGLLEWIGMRSEDEMQKYVFLPLKQLFISSGTYVQSKIIKTMGKMLMNLLVLYKGEINLFQSSCEEFNLVKTFGDCCAFVGELIAYGLIANKEKKSRKILMAALDFYETAQAIEQAGDLPIIIIMPPSLVYKCLFSSSRVCIARICTLLNSSRSLSIERLYQLGVFEDFADEVHQLRTYMLDYYRCLWSTLTFKKEEESFIFHEDVFKQMFAEFKKNYGDVVDKAFNVEYNSSLWIPQLMGQREETMKELAMNYPSILQLKEIMETQSTNE